MENRNVIIAVILSTAILIGWSMYFENPDEAQRKDLKFKEKRKLKLIFKNQKLLKLQKQIQQKLFPEVRH